MTNFFYTDANGNKVGPVSEEQLKALAAQGIINPHTPMETDTGYKGVAGQIPGLFPTVPPPPPPPPPTSAPPHAPRQLFCTNCGNSISEQAVACMSCGAKPVGHKKFCRQCGAGVGHEQVICIKCGASISAVSVPGLSPKSKIVAGIFALLLGAFGAHKFYLGSYGWGILFLCFTILTCFYGSIITGICAVVEGILYLVMTDEAFAEKYPLETQQPFRW